MTKTNLSATIDAWGELKAEMAALELREKALKAALADLEPGAYEGEQYRLTISDSIRESLDMKAVRAHLSRQFIAAHTRETPTRTHKVVARTGDGVTA